MGQRPIIDGFELSTTRRTLPMALLRARELVMERFRPVLQEHGVTEQQWRVLRVLQEADEVDASELAEGACILAPSLTRILKALEGRGFIAIGKDPEDRRRALIRLTRAGDAFIREIAPSSASIYTDLEARIGRAEIEGLLDQLERLVEVLSRD